MNLIQILMTPSEVMNKIIVTIVLKVSILLILILLIKNLKIAKKNLILGLPKMYWLRFCLGL